MQNKSRAFTLIELLVVVLIIGILAAVAVPQYEKAVVRARVARLLPLMKSIETAQEIYKMANGEYSADLTVLDIEMPGGAKTTSTNSRVNYDDFSCNIGNLGAENDSFYCKDNRYTFSLEKYYGKNLFCWAPSTDNSAKKLCGYLCQTSTFGLYGDLNFCKVNM